MYSSRGSNAYGQQQQQQPKPQSYSSQSAYGQNLGPDTASQMSIASRHSALLGGHSSAGAHYGGQYTSVYGSTALNSALQVPATSAKGAGPSVLEGRSGYGSTLQESSKFTSGDYPAASQKEEISETDLGYRTAAGRILYLLPKSLAAWWTLSIRRLPSSFNRSVNEAIVAWCPRYVVEAAKLL
ncbi:hypothetical protein Ccrd_018215, partial [Cynara cardunculus var. scolymus]